MTHTDKEIAEARHKNPYDSAIEVKQSEVEWTSLPPAKPSNSTPPEVKNNSKQPNDSIKLPQDVASSKDLLFETSRLSQKSPHQPDTLPDSPPPAEPLLISHPPVTFYPPYPFNPHPPSYQQFLPYPPVIFHPTPQNPYGLLTYYPPHNK
jgi:hypothetical protein